MKHLKKIQQVTHQLGHGNAAIVAFALLGFGVMCPAFLHKGTRKQAMF